MVIYGGIFSLVCKQVGGWPGSQVTVPWLLSLCVWLSLSREQSGWGLSTPAQAGSSAEVLAYCSCGLTRYLATLCLSFPICKAGITVILISGSCVKWDDAGGALSNRASHKECAVEVLLVSVECEQKEGSVANMGRTISVQGACHRWGGRFKSESPCPSWVWGTVTWEEAAGSKLVMSSLVTHRPNCTPKFSCGLRAQEPWSEGPL